MGGGSPGWRRVIVLATLGFVAVSCSSSTKSTASSASSTTTSPTKQGLAFQLSGDLTGGTDASSTKVSRCSTVNAQLLFEGTVSLGGEELSVKLTSGNSPSIEIVDLVSDRTWLAPAPGDSTATISVHSDTPTSGSITAVASTAAVPPTHLDVQGTYGC